MSQFFYSTVCSGTDQRKHESSASLVFVRGIQGCLVNSLHKGPITRKMFQSCWSTVCEKAVQAKMLLFKLCHYKWSNRYLLCITWWFKHRRKQNKHNITQYSLTWKINYVGTYLLQHPQVSTMDKRICTPDSAFLGNAAAHFMSVNCTPRVLDLRKLKSKPSVLFDTCINNHTPSFCQMKSLTHGPVSPMGWLKWYKLSKMKRVDILQGQTM